MVDDSPVTIATLPVESETAEPVKQETLPQTQVHVEPQTTDTPQVEGADNKPQSQEHSRPYDGLFRQERKRIRRLEETNSQLLKKLTEFETLLKPQNVQSEPLDHSLLLTEPDRYLSQREQKLVNEINALRGEVTNWKQTQEIQAQERRGLEALEKLFPKSSPDSKETLEDRVNKDPERADRLREFFNRPSVKAMADIDPDEAVEYAMEKLGLKESKPNPLVLKKSAMGGVNTGNPSMGTKISVSEQDLLSQLKKLNEQLSQDSSLRLDDNFKKRKAEVISALQKLVYK